MSVEISCPHCSRTLRVPESAEGRTGQCPRCQETMTIEFPPSMRREAKRSEPKRVVRQASAPSAFDEDEEELTPRRKSRPVRSARVEPEPEPEPDFEPDYTPKPRKKKKKKSTNYIGYLIGGGGTLTTILVFLLIAAKAGLNIKRIADSFPANATLTWQRFQGNGISADLPGKPTVQTRNEGGALITMAMIEPNRQSAFGVGWTDVEMPPENQMPMSENAMLEQITTAQVNNQRGRLVSAGPVSQNGCKGREVIFSMPNGGQMFSRVFIARNRKVVIAVCGGSKYTQASSDVQHFFNSITL